MLHFMFKLILPRPTSVMYMKDEEKKLMQQHTSFGTICRQKELHWCTGWYLTQKELMNWQ